MSIFRFRGLGGNQWPAFPPVETSPLWAAYRQLVESQWLSAEQIEHRQVQQLQLLWKHCLENCPYYQQFTDISPQSIRSLDDLQKLPILERRTIQQNTIALNATRLPEGVERIGTVKTSGTSGVPLVIHQTNVVNLWWLACFLRDLEWCGMDPRGRLAAIRAFTKKGEEHQRLLAGQQRPYWSRSLHALIETGPSFGMDVHQDPGRQLEWLFEIQPDYLLTNPSNLVMLAGLIKEKGQRIASLKCVQLTGESLPADVREDLQSVLEVPLKDLYSCSEAGYVASPCPDCSGFHVHGENVILEVLDDEDRACGPGQSGRVVITTLQNFQMPLVRYEIQDEATLASEPCSCGRQLLRLSAVRGKLRPFFVLPDGRRKNSAGLIVEIRDLGRHHQYQIIQSATDHVVVHIVPDSTWTDECSDKIRQLVRSYFESSVQVTVETTARIEPTAGGKVRGVLVQIA